MDAPAYYPVYSAMNTSYVAHTEAYGGTGESPSLPPEYVSNGYHDLSYSPQWLHGMDGYAPACPSIDEDLYSVL